MARRVNRGIVVLKDTKDKKIMDNLLASINSAKAEYEAIVSAIKLKNKELDLLESIKTEKEKRSTKVSAELSNIEQRLAEKEQAIKIVSDELAYKMAELEQATKSLDIINNGIEFEKELLLKTIKSRQDSENEFLQFIKAKKETQETIKEDLKKELDGIRLEIDNISAKRNAVKLEASSKIEEDKRSIELASKELEEVKKNREEIMASIIKEAVIRRKTIEEKIAGLEKVFDEKYKETMNILHQSEEAKKNTKSIFDSMETAKQQLSVIMQEIQNTKEFREQEVRRTAEKISSERQELSKIIDQKFAIAKANKDLRNMYNYIKRLYEQANVPMPNIDINLK